MSTTKKQKKSIVQELKKLFEKASILVFVNFHGLSVAKERKLRGEFRKSEVKYKVAKKTLLKRALGAMGLTDAPKLEGEIGIAAGYGEATEPPALISKFIKTEFRGLSADRRGLKIIGGIYESKFVDGDVIGRLAAIPPREVLLTQLAFILSQPMASLARVFKEVEKKIRS